MEADEHIQLVREESSSPPPPEEKIDTTAQLPGYEPSADEELEPIRVTLPSRRFPRMHVSRAGAFWAGLVFCACTMVILGIVLPIMLNDAASTDRPSEQGNATRTWQQFAALLANASDASVDPCTSFYNRTCGALLANTVLTPDQGSAGSFTIIADRIQTQLHTIADQGWPLVGTWYDACMNASGRSAHGTTALAQLFDTVLAANTPEKFARAVATLHAHGVSALFSAYVAPDELYPSTRNLLYIDEARSALPYSVWVSNDTIAAQERANLLQQLSVLQNDAAVADALSIDQDQLARWALTPTEARHQQQRNLVNVSALPTQFAWDAYLDQLNVTTQQVSLPSPNYVQHAMATISANSWAEWQNYLVVRIVLTYYSDLPTRAPIDWQQCLDSVEAFLGPLLGHYYVTEYFPPSTKPSVETLIDNIIEAFGGRIRSATWMDASTRAAALGKLAAIRPMIAFPDEWDDSMPSFPVSHTDHLANVLNATVAAVRDNLRSLHSAPKRYHWLMDAFTVNAYYEPQENDIVFPAGILQGSFFHPDAPLAINYGAIGVVIGHEITHGFDDQGREYDAGGVHTNWWSAEATRAFEERAQCVVDLYSSYRGVQGEHVDGLLTLGENLADLGGLATAWDAYHVALNATYAPDDLEAYKRDVQRTFGMTHEQLFYASYGYTWCTKVSPERAYARLHSDPHSPPRWRVDGPTSQSDPFAGAFECTHANETCAVW